MKNSFSLKCKLAVSLLFFAFAFKSYSQSLKNLDFGDKGLSVKGFNLKYETSRTLPLVSFLLDSHLINSQELSKKSDKRASNSKIELRWKLYNKYEDFRGELIFKNISDDTISIRNVVPFGENENHTYITGLGDHSLSRTHLFRPGYAPVNVIVPDNAWELGYSGFSINDEVSVCSLVRRTAVKKASKRRFETLVEPGGSVTYTLYADFYNGKWQEGLRKIFQENYLYDVEKFDNTLFERDDLKWMRHSYAIHLLFAWDRKFHDSENQEFNLDKFLDRGKELYGGDDVIGVWPTWPALGLDQRNQWDLFRDLPGGLDQLKSLADMAREKNTKFFICYNPWDESTRDEGHIEGMADLISRTGSDGVVLDTKGSSSDELQEGADSVRDGVIMYSEGMAVPKDMQGIVSGRVHNALYYPPMLNLNKFIKPEFAIFRVAELAFDRIRREYALSFFNGYGTELNIFRPGQPEWVEEDYKFFGRTLRILRENTSNFIQKEYTPLIKTSQDSIYVNKWPKEDKTLYTIFSLKPSGFKGQLFEVEPKDGYHYFDLWNHKEVELDTIGGKYFANVDVEGFSRKWLGTNNEGAVGAIAKLPNKLDVSLDEDKLTFSATDGNEVKIWAGNPEYSKTPKIYSIQKQVVRLIEEFGYYEGHFVIQLFEKQELIDEKVVYIEPGTPRLISESIRTSKVKNVPVGMVKIPDGQFVMKVSQGDQFIPYPDAPVTGEISVDGFYMDKYPVTNAQFKAFLDATNYKPKNDKNYLKTWRDGVYPKGKGNYPVVHVSYEDALAYCKWAGKRLPTELEWQYAAQTEKLNEWPWGNDQFKVQKKDQFVTNTLTVTDYEGLDNKLANLGNNEMDPVGSYPKGANPYGLEDLVGSVWQMTNDVYDNTTNQFIILKGGSYYKPASSWWYVQGGPRKLHYRQQLLRVSPGFERNATVGFRCVKDYN